MRVKAKYAVYVGDEINEDGLRYLRGRKIEVRKICGLKNKELINKLASVHPVSLQKKGILIIRTIRTLNANEITLIKKTTGISMICAASSGYDNIDTSTAKKLGIRVMNVPEATSTGAAEHTIAMILALIKNIGPADKDMKSGIFDFRKFSNTELLGKNLGIIGVGRVGSRVARIAKAFGMNVLGNDIKRSLATKYSWISFLPLNELLKRADIITVHTPLDKSTKNLLNEVNMGKLKESAIIVNCARGGIIDEKALIALLKRGRVCYGAVDVFETEPAFNKAFRSLKNVILTPHLAGKTVESKQRVSAQLARQIHGFYTGKSSIGIIC